MRASPFLLYLLLTLVSSIALASPARTDHGISSILSASSLDIIAPHPVSHEASILLVDSGPLAGGGNRFTKKQKVILKERNASANEGKVRCENCDVETVPAQKHEKNITPPTNEAHTDHKVPRSKGGKADLDNGQILCRDCNLEKSDKSQ
jgi:hypothetical protein